jgi:erythritol transport system ATP-binding protein
MNVPVDPSDFVLEARGLTKVFPGTVALNGVDVRLRRGSVHALIGENGAGKSTLVRIIAGVEQPTSGTLTFEGETIALRSARDADARGIAIVHQELQRFPNLSVAENLFVGRELTTRFGTVDHAAQRHAARDLLARLGQPIDPDVLLGSLPLGLQQVVEIARALTHQTRVLLMDEPTSALSASEVRVLFRLIRDLRARGVSIVYISHRLEELLEIADAVTVLRDGCVAGAADTSDIDVRWILERMTGRPVHNRPPHAARPCGDPLLAVRALALPARPGRAAVTEVSFDVHAGESVGIYGLMGAGRTELLETLMGVHADASGSVRLDTRPLETLSVSDRVSAGLAIVPEDRQRAGLVTTMSVRENMTLSSLGQFGHAGYVSAASEHRTATRLAGDVRLKAPGIDAPVTTLSGGNQQKVVIARALMSGPRVLLLDEPSRGVDVGARAEIIECLQQLADRGMGVVFTSSDLDEILAAASRVLVMTRGRIAGDYAAADATPAVLASIASATEQRSSSEGSLRGE